MEDKSKLKNTGAFLLFAGPSTLAFFAVIVIPFIYGVWLTFTDWNGIANSRNFVGFANYIALFKDTMFWKSMAMTVAYAAVSVLLINLMGYLLAMLLSGKMRGRGFMRAGFFTPNLIGGIVLGFIWRFVFDKVLTIVGQSTGFGIFVGSWLSDPGKAFWALVVVTVWQYSGYMMIIYLAGLAGIPQDVKEAASIDGCTGLSQLRFITLPLMVSSFVICLFLSVSRTFMVYDLNLALTSGGPYGSTVLAAMHVYQKAFVSREYGTGQAEAILLFLVVAFITAMQTWIGKRQEVEA